MSYRKYGQLCILDFLSGVGVEKGLGTSPRREVRMEDYFYFSIYRITDILVLGEKKKKRSVN